MLGFEYWNWKYSRFVPVEILEKLDSEFIRVRLDTDQKEETTTYISSIREIGKRDLDILSLFSENTMLSVNGFDLIVSRAEFDKEDNIRLFYKYIQCDENKQREIREKNPAWSWINYYGVQYEKVNAGYNFITIKPDDRIVFRCFIPSRIEEHRKEWYFEDPVSRGCIVYLEKLLGYTRPDGKTWMEYFWEGTDEKKLGVKIKDDGTLVCFDVRDPKKPVQICNETEVETFIEKVFEYAKDKMEEPETVA